MPPTFETLKIRMRDWLSVDTGRISDAVCGDLLNLSMRELLRKHDFRFGETSDTLATVAGTFDYDLPTGWSRTHTLWYLDPADSSSVVFLDYLSKEDFDVKFPDTTTADDPTAYTVWGSKMRLGPTPEQALTVNRNYYKILDELADGGSTNENGFTKDAWEAIFFRALNEATKYLIEDPRAALWEAKARDTELQLLLEHSRARHSGRRLVIEEPG